MPDPDLEQVERNDSAELDTPGRPPDTPRHPRGAPGGAPRKLPNTSRDAADAPDNGVLNSCLAEGSDDESGYSPSMEGGEPYSDDEHRRKLCHGGEADGGLEAPPGTEWHWQRPQPPGPPGAEVQHQEPLRLGAPGCASTASAPAESSGDAPGGAAERRESEGMNLGHQCRMHAS